MVAVLSGKRTSGSTSVVVERRSPQMAFEPSLFKGGFREPSRRGVSALRAFILHSTGFDMRAPLARERTTPR